MLKQVQHDTDKFILNNHYRHPDEGQDLILSLTGKLQSINHNNNRLIKGIKHEPIFLRSPR